tara:strand:+ start:267 stop:896 length:630 start_codon:yes stop_codon:yes gene_type:complete
MFLLPEKDCAICPRLADFRAECRAAYPDKFNAPVPSFGPDNAKVLVVGLAPGLRGANFTGRPFTGDYAGDLLYDTLLKFGFARGQYRADPNDGLELVDARITNAVRCLPPENKPVGAEINNCRPFLVSEIENLKNLKVIMCLGLIAHNSVLKALGARQADHKFIHGAVHEIGALRVIDSYHCSRYNTNTGRLTTPMFEGVFKTIQTLLN